MSSELALVRVHPLSDVRQRLSEIVARFRGDDPSTEPVVFGSHRKPEAVVLPFAVYEKLVESARRLEAAQQAAASVRAEGLEPSADMIERSERWVRGEIDEDQMYEETLRQYRRS